MKHFYDRHSEMQPFSEGDQLLALLPIVGSPFQAKFVGPYTVVRQLSEQNYLTENPDRRKRNQLCHINLLKPYYVSASSQVMSGPSDSPSSEVCAVLTACTVVQSAFCGGEDVVAPDDSLLRGCLKNSESLQNLDVLSTHLTVEKCTELAELIELSIFIW